VPSPEGTLRAAWVGDRLLEVALLVEVPSDGTAGYDRGEKFEHDQGIESLRDYVLVSQHQRRVEVYSRDTAQRWVLRITLAGESVVLTAMPGVIEVDRVYEGVALSPAPLLPVRGG
jgi:Uma2 family endonuclease